MPGRGAPPTTLGGHHGTLLLSSHVSASPQEQHRISGMTTTLFSLFMDQSQRGLSILLKASRIDTSKESRLAPRNQRLLSVITERLLKPESVFLDI